MTGPDDIDRGRHPSAGSHRRLSRTSDARLVELMRRGHDDAFEALYERHAEGLRSLCDYLLDGRGESEDALQTTFISAYRWLLTEQRPVDVRPWLYTIARNTSLNILRERRQAELAQPVSLPAEIDPAAATEHKEDLHAALAAIAELPESQRTALVLAEMHGLGHRQIASVLGVEPKQVKAYVFQARAHLLADRAAHDADCASIREELEHSRGGSLLKTRLRRHLRYCQGCRSYAAQLTRQRRRLGALLPLQPLLDLRKRFAHVFLDGSLSRSGEYAGAGTGAGVSLAAGIGLAGNGSKVVLAKLLAGIALLGHAPASSAPTPMRGDNATGRTFTLRHADITGPAAYGHRARYLSARRHRHLAARVPAPATPAMPTVTSTATTGEALRGESPSVPTEAQQAAPPHGKSEEAPGHSTRHEAPGQAQKGSETPAIEENTHGKSAEAPGQLAAPEGTASSQEAGYSGKVPPGQQQEKTHGHEREEDRAHGQSELEHGKGN
jgi:RNA polymerase sigma factor (sigma-70 family)